MRSSRSHDIRQAQIAAGRLPEIQLASTCLRRRWLRRDGDDAVTPLVSTPAQRRSPTPVHLPSSIARLAAAVTNSPSPTTPADRDPCRDRQGRTPSRDGDFDDARLRMPVFVLATPTVVDNGTLTGTGHLHPDSNIFTFRASDTFEHRPRSDAVAETPPATPDGARQPRQPTSRRPATR